MRVFVTGATGYIGLPMVEAFVTAGHEVLGLVRDDEKARAMTSRGASAVVGDMGDPKSYHAAVAACDGVVHASWEASPRGPSLDRLAIEHLLSALRGERNRRDSSPPFFIYTSGVWILGNTNGPAAEDAPVNPVPHVAWRPASERLVVEGAGQDVRAVVVRPGIVYGGSRGIIGDLFRDATAGVVRLVGSGENRWATIYDRDLADLYVRLASSPAAGIYHACDETDDRVAGIVGAIAATVEPAPDVRNVSLEEATAQLGTYAGALALDQTVRCPRARALGWTPTLAGIVRNAARLFEEWRTAYRAHPASG